MHDISNILIGIRNTLSSKRFIYQFKPHSLKISFALLRVLYEEGIILSYNYDKLLNKIVVYNNYYKNKPSVSIIKVYNKASFPVYIKYTDLLAIHKFGVDLLILSTTKGFLPHYKAIKAKLGGKLICYIR